MFLNGGTSRVSKIENYWLVASPFVSVTPRCKPLLLQKPPLPPPPTTKLPNIRFMPKTFEENLLWTIFPNIFLTFSLFWVSLRIFFVAFTSFGFNVDYIYVVLGCLQKKTERKESILTFLYVITWCGSNIDRILNTILILSKTSFISFGFFSSIKTHFRHYPTVKSDF